MNRKEIEFYLKFLKEDYYDAIIVAIGNDQFKQMGFQSIRKLGRKKNIIFNLRHIFKKAEQI